MLLAGAVREEPGEQAGSVTGRYYNSVMAVTTGGVIAGAADKVHLVPFGEYLPFADLLSAIGLRAVAAADRGWIDREQAMIESVLHIRRAGASIILSYFALELAALLGRGRS